MALLDDVGTWLAEQGVGVFTLDPTNTSQTRTIYASVQPDQPDQQIALFEYGGLEPISVHDQTVGVNGAALERPAFQVMTRGVPDDYQDARALADQAYKAILFMQAMTVNGVYYFRVIPKQTVTPLGRDDKRRPMFVFNCSVLRALQ